MKISSKGRYALASMILLAQSAPSGTLLTAAGISGRLRLSKIYLEQVFTLLRQGGLVTAVKGAQGGYLLARDASEISAADILTVTENAIFEDVESTFEDADPGMERALQSMLFSPANQAFKEVFEQILLSDLAEESLQGAADDSFTYCI